MPKHKVADAFNRAFPLAHQKVGVGLLVAAPISAIMLPEHISSSAQVFLEISGIVGLVIAGKALLSYSSTKGGVETNLEISEECKICDIEGFVSKHFVRGARFVLDSLMRKG